MEAIPDLKAGARPMRGRSVISRFTSLAVVCMLGCGSSTSAEIDLAVARDRWTSLAPSAYTMTIVRTCECLPEMSGPVTVVVRNGVVESRHYAPSGVAVASRYAELFPSVIGLFALVEDAVRDGTLPLRAEFDPILGYPVHIIIGDPATDAPVYAVSEFRAL
ncbi:MAG: DUF6174 domain-containing protein [Gemmatimonadaceae bacterium]